MNGHLIEQSVTHALQQRFCAIIELGPAPFIDNAGPLDFVTDDFIGIANCTVKNGIICRSCHHSIHGNDCGGIRLENITFRDYEVAAIALNRVQGCKIVDCVLENSRTDVPVRGTYSAGRFIRGFVGMILQNSELPSEDRIRGQALLDALKQRMEKTRKQVELTGRTMDPLFANESGISDGGAGYAIVINGKGPAVNEFAGFGNVDPSDDAALKSLMSHDVTIENTTIGTTLLHSHQVIGLSTVPESNSEVANRYGGGVQKSPDGAVFQIETVVDNDGHYVGNTLSDLQIFVAQHRQYMRKSMADRVTISPGIVSWALDTTSTITLEQVMTDENLTFRYNGDGWTLFEKCHY